MICVICERTIEPGEPTKRVSRRSRTGGTLPPAYSHKLCRRRPSTVPFITSWSSEIVTDPPVTYRLLGGIRYADEVASDRTADGVLIMRRPDRQGVGEPKYSMVHPGRQFRAMTELLCQVCGGPADQNERGTLWLLDDSREDWSGWPNDLVTTHPPVCLQCVRKAREECRHMWAGNVLARVRTSEVYGVLGRRYTASRLGPLPVHRDIVPFGSPLLGWTVAAQLVRALDDCTVVTLDEELAVAAATAH
ncbi:hypothetical protein CQW39_09775 [Streptomyces griseofuscus]|uniref:hypothetical protein n=1 Tax=Streptomyces griseofuscus TaxID=146922 RepID=UPI000F64B320|nr:hypothetical protein [Streptomyces griseofuscus]RRQ79418.1 hypothetical protein CQW39_09775 [Streptomyces griseofuscus]